MASRRKVFEKVLWSNAGSAVLSGMASASARFPLMTDTLGSGTLTSGSSGSWAKLALGGMVDHLYICWKSLVTDAGDITAIPLGSQQSASVIAVADWVDTGYGPVLAFSNPNVGATPGNTTGATSTASKSQYRGTNLDVMHFDAAATQAGPAVGDVVGVYSGAVIGATAAVPAGNFHWVAKVGERHVLGAGGAGAPTSDTLVVSGLQNVYVAVGFFQTVTGTAAQLKVQAELVAVGFRDVLDVQSQDSLRGINQRSLNISATT